MDGVQIIITKCFFLPKSKCCYKKYIIIQYNIHLSRMWVDRSDMTSASMVGRCLTAALSDHHLNLSDENVNPAGGHIYVLL